MCPSFNSSVTAFYHRIWLCSCLTYFCFRLPWHLLVRQRQYKQFIKSHTAWTWSIFCTKAATSIRTKNSAGCAEPGMWFEARWWTWLQLSNSLCRARIEVDDTTATNAQSSCSCCSIRSLMYNTGTINKDGSSPELHARLACAPTCSTPSRKLI